jgi:hypothetical protein
VAPSVIRTARAGGGKAAPAPVEDALTPQEGIGDSEEGEKGQHFPQRVHRATAAERAEVDGPGVEEGDLDVENDENQRYEVELD